MNPANRKFSNLETKVLRELLRDGACNKDIAKRIGSTAGSVASRINQIGSSLGLSGRLPIALWAERSGLFREDQS